jgi:hypothetical protein
LNLKKTRGKIITWERFFTASLCFGSGASNGIHEIINYKYHKFKGVHPNANDQYFNPQLSHTNKWKGGDIRNGEKFFLSSTAFVSLTDFKHALGFIQKNLLVGAIVINIGQPLKKWYIYALEFIAYSASWSVGFHTTYSLLYGGMRP